MSRELMHFGIPGMRWGVSRGRNVSKGPRPKKPKAKSLSDAELRTKINRMNMEKQYNQLSRPKLDRGKKIIGGLLIGIATVRVSKLLNTAVDTGISKAGEVAVNLYLKAKG